MFSSSDTSDSDPEGVSSESDHSLLSFDVFFFEKSRILSSRMYCLAVFCISFHSSVARSCRNLSISQSHLKTRSAYGICAESSSRCTCADETQFQFFNISCRAAEFCFFVSDLPEDERVLEHKGSGQCFVYHHTYQAASRCET